MKKLLLILCSFAFAINLSAQVGPKGPALTTNTTTYTVEQLIQEIFVNGCVEVSNITINGGGAAGYFDATGTSFPFATDGIIIASGAVSNAQGPNSSGSLGSTLSSGGDPDLQLLIPGYTINDATILEFDFVPSSDTINFEYIFGSEEYPEYVGSSFNDVFGFFLSGPGISGPYSGGAINIALIPGTTLPVTIDNVNIGSYSAFYIDNTGGDACQYDGFTVPLTATAIITACQTYHIKLAIGDAGDSAYDSGVFFASGSFDSGGNVLMENPDPIFGENNELYEGCQNYYVFSRLDQSAAALLDSIQVFLNYGGDATYGADYTALPYSIWISVGEIYDTIWFEAFNDGILESIEFFTIDLLSGCPCSLESVSDTIWINDFIIFKAGVTPNDLRYCDGEAPDSIMIRGYSDSHPSEFLYYQWSTGVVGPTDSIIWVHPSPGYNIYYATISDLCESHVTDSCIIVISDLSGTTFDIQSNALCRDDCLGEMHVSPDGISPPFTLQWVFSVTGTPAPSEDMFGLCRGFYYLKVSDAVGCFVNHSFNIVDPVELEIDYFNLVPDYYGCSGQANPVVLGGTPPYFYAWSSGGSGSPATDLCPGVHTVTITDANGCSVSDVFIIDNLTEVDNFVKNNKVKVYPNPSNSGNITMEFEYTQEKMEVELIDINGRIINCEDIPAKTIMYVLKNIPNGTYMLRVTTENNLILLQRIVVNQ